MAQDILDAFAPLNLISKVCGYSLFTISRKDYTATFKRIDFAFLTWIVAVFCFLSAFSFDVRDSLPMHKSDIISKCLPIFLCLSYGLYLFTIIATIVTRRKQSLLIKSICDIDEMLRDFGFGFDYHRQQRVLVYKIIAMLFVDVVIVIQCYIIQRIHKVQSSFSSIAVCYFWSLLYFTVFIMNYVFMADAVRQRFAKINECLKKKALTTVDVKKLAAIHSLLTGVIGLINQIYSVFVMLYFGGIFCIFNLFLFSLVITKNYYQDLTEAIVMTVANFEWNLYDVALVFIVIRATTGATSEGRKTMNLIYKIVNTSMDGKLNGRLMNFSHQVTSSRMNFTCGLFNYDWSLCFKLISASVMYLLILIQFESTLPKKNAAN